MLFVGICLVGVIVSYAIFRMSNDSSFIYDDEEQMEDELKEEENEQELNTID